MPDLPPKVLQARAELLAVRWWPWSLGEMDARLVEAYGPGTVRQLAMQEGVDAMTVRQRITVARAYAGLAEKPLKWTLARAALQYAQRHQVDPVAVLTSVLEAGDGVKVLAS